MKKLYTYPPLAGGKLIKRYKRFLADVLLEDGSQATVFCPNSGSMMGLKDPGIPVLLSASDNPERKTRWTLEAVKPGRVWVGVNTHLTNTFAARAIEMGLLDGSPLKGFRVARAEVTVGNSRLDFLLSREKTRGKESCHLEIKSVTLRIDGKAMFPDAVTTRGAKHMRELLRIVKKGGRAGVLFLVQRADCECFAPASRIDPAYAQSLKRAKDAGVDVMVCGLRVRREGVYFEKLMPFKAT
ncbi:MAG TPA: DNA/RNA nuclease SfsA [Nitrospirae bacterium]|nr:DNA/RNA nuclease SfsA [Nitrospirota bacterium]